MRALNAGDLAGAQSAFASLQALQPGRFAVPANSQSSNGAQSVNGTSSIGADIATLGQALQSGDLSGAQSAFQKVQQDMHSVRHGHHHHAHKSADDAQQALSSTDGTDAANPFGEGKPGVLA